MRSPFAEPRTRTPTPLPRAPGPSEVAVEVSLEEAALFDLPKPRTKPSSKPALRRSTMAPGHPPPPRRSVAPPPEHETTSKYTVSPDLISAIRERDSVRMRQAIRAAIAVDLSKTSEEPVLCEDFLETSSVRRSE